MTDERQDDGPVDDARDRARDAVFELDAAYATLGVDPDEEPRGRSGLDDADVHEAARRINKALALLSALAATHEKIREHAEAMKAERWKPQQGASEYNDRIDEHAEAILALVGHAATAR